MTQRTNRVDELLQQEIGAILERDLADPRIGFVTVTGVEVSADLSHATVRVSVMGSDAERAQTLAGLASAAGHVRSQLARRLATRVTPEVVFQLDRGIEHAARIDRVLRALKAGDAPEDAG